MSKRLLLAFGNVSVAEEYATQLTRKEFIVDVVNDGDAVLEYLRAHTEPPDCILLEAALSGKSGFVVFEEIRAGLVPPKTPVIVLSATGEANDLERCNALGVTKCIVTIRSTPESVAREVWDVVSGVAHPLDVGSVPRREAEPTPQDTETYSLLGGKP